MEFTGRLIKHISLKTEYDDHNCNYDINMYTKPDTETITIEEFQSLGMKRLSALRALELLREKHGSDQEKYKEAFKKEIGELVPLFCKKELALNVKKSRRDDRISHFILRLAFCQNTNLSEWFLRQETELFRLRFQLEAEKNVLAFLRDNDIVPEEVDKSEKYNLLNDLSHALTLSSDSITNSPLYKINCWDVVELLPTYRIYLRNGFAYITSNDLVALVAPRFRENIFNSLSHARNRIGLLEEEDRLIPLMKTMMDGGITYRKEFRDTNIGQISPGMVDDLTKSFPLCMQNIHFHMRREHHIKHYARQQYGLFLKGVGLSMEDSLEFFRMEFTKKIDNEKFSKQYAYNIRHMYGKEGNRIDHKPYSCATIILGSTPTALDCHGCPFKHSDATSLSRKLQLNGLDSNQIANIIDLSKMNRFDKACTKYFEIVHKVTELEELITHPNQYYSLSRKVISGNFTYKKDADMEEITDMDF